MMLLKDKFFSTLFIDFRGEVVRVVQGRPMDNNLIFTVDNFGTIVLPGHLGYNVKRELVSNNANKLKEFLNKKMMRSVKVVAGMGQSGVITRNVRVPKMNPKDLENMMKLNINDYLPVSSKEYAFDYKVLNEVEEDSRSYLELMVAAVNHDQIEQCTLLLELAGLKPLVFDILPNMLHRLFGHMVYQDNLVVDGGPNGTHLVIFKGKNLFMYADIPFTVNPLGNNDFSIIAREIKGYLDYFSSRNFGKTVDSITVLGDLVALPELVEIMEQLFTIHVTVGLTQVGPLNFKGKANNFSDQASVYAGNLGLMMREDSQSSEAIPVIPNTKLASKILSDA